MIRKDAFLEKVVQDIENLGMILPGDRVAVGVSGGADSVCLLEVLHRYRERVGFALSVIHVEHGLRGADSLADAVFVEALCARLRLPCRVISVDVRKRAEQTGESLEEAARYLRYGAFGRVCREEGCNKLAVAHNQNDQAETVLLNLARGSGLSGLGGMRAVRGPGFLEESNLTIIRPLLSVDRAQIEKWLYEQGIAYCTDRTNQEPEYARNRMRLQILPLLERQINAKATKHIAETALRLQKAEAYLRKQAGDLCEKRVEIRKNGVALRLAGFLETDEVLQEYMLRQVLAQILEGRGLKDYTSTHIEALRRLAGQPCGKQLDLPGGLRAARQYGEILFWKPPKKAWRKESGTSLEKAQEDGREASPEKTRKDGRKAMTDSDVPSCLPLTSDGIYEFLGRHFRVEYQDSPAEIGEIEEKKYTKWIAYDTIKDNICLRTRRPGDYLVVNRDGGRKKLKDYLIDQKVPQPERSRVPLVAEDSHVLWVVGWRISEAAKVTEDTEKVVKIQMEEEE